MVNSNNAPMITAPIKDAIVAITAITTPIIPHAQRSMAGDMAMIAGKNT